MVLRVRDYGIAQGADSRNLDLNHVAGVDLLYSTRGSGEYDVAGVQGGVLADAAHDGVAVVNHAGGAAPVRLASVQAGDDFEVMGVHVGFDPRTHGAEGVAALLTPVRYIRVP